MILLYFYYYPLSKLHILYELLTHHEQKKTPARGCRGQRFFLNGRGSKFWGGGRPSARPTPPDPVCRRVRIYLNSPGIVHSLRRFPTLSFFTSQRGSSGCAGGWSGRSSGGCSMPFKRNSPAFCAWFWISSAKYWVIPCSNSLLSPWSCSDLGKKKSRISKFSASDLEGEAWVGPCQSLNSRERQASLTGSRQARLVKNCPWDVGCSAGGGRGSFAPGLGSLAGGGTEPPQVPALGSSEL